MNSNQDFAITQKAIAKKVWLLYKALGNPYLASL